MQEKELNQKQMVQINIIMKTQKCYHQTYDHNTEAVYTALQFKGLISQHVCKYMQLLSSQLAKYLFYVAIWLNVTYFNFNIYMYVVTLYVAKSAVADLICTFTSVQVEFQNSGDKMWNQIYTTLQIHYRCSHKTIHLHRPMFFIIFVPI